MQAKTMALTLVGILVLAGVLGAEHDKVINLFGNDDMETGADGGRMLRCVP